MLLLLFAVGLFVISGFVALLAQKSVFWSTGIGVGGVVTGGVIGLVPVLRVLLGTPALSLHLPWQVPYGAFFVEVDPLSAFFLLPVFALSALAAVLRCADPAGAVGLETRVGYERCWDSPYPSRPTACSSAAQRHQPNESDGGRSRRAATATAIL
jgi:hypothetical protein